MLYPVVLPLPVAAAFLVALALWAARQRPERAAWHPRTGGRHRLATTANPYRGWATLAPAALVENTAELATVQ